MSDRAETSPVEAPPRVARQLLRAVALLAALLAIVAFAPGLEEVRRLLRHAAPGWIAVAVALQALSCLSYVLMFRRMFRGPLSKRRSRQLAWAQLGMGSIVPASGAGGLALGAWVLHREGVPAEWIAHRSVAFFLLKSGVNFVAVVIVGVLLAVGLVGPAQPPWLTALPAALALAAIVAAIALGRLRQGDRARPDASRPRRWWTALRRAIVGGLHVALRPEHLRDPRLIAGSVGYWIFDNAVLWATYHAVDVAPPVSVILMGYLIGQLGGALPLPGGVGGIELGLVGTMVVYGAPAAATAAAVLAYRVILFWLPLLVGAVAFWRLVRGLREHRP